MSDPYGLESWQWHHQIPKRYWDPGQRLYPYRHLMDQPWNGWMLPRGIHKGTFGNEYGNAVLGQINRRIRPGMTDDQVKRALQRAIQDLHREWWERVFRHGVQATMTYGRWHDIGRSARHAASRRLAASVVVRRGVVAVPILGWIAGAFLAILDALWLYSAIETWVEESRRDYEDYYERREEYFTVPYDPNSEGWWDAIERRSGRHNIIR